MREFLDSIRKSFSARLSIWVVLFTALVFLTMMIYAVSISRQSVKREAMKTAGQVLENTELRLDSIIDEVEAIADNVEWLVYRHLDSPESMLEYTRSAVQGNRFLSGCSISFEPYFFEGMKYFSAYSSNTDGVIETIQEGDDDYQYFYLDWYLMPKLLNQPCWTEPYNDWEYDDDYYLPTEMLISYCKPLTDADGNFFGAISLDLSIKWLSESISSVKPYPNSYGVLMSRGGTFIVHPDPEKLFYRTIFTSSLAEDDTDFERIGHRVIGGEEGMEEVDIDGEDSFMFFKPMKSTGWSIAIVSPEKEIFNGFNRFMAFVYFIITIGLTLIFFTCFHVISKAVEPLEELAEQAENIAEGNFTTALPKSDRADEIGTLSRSFSHMQTSLVEYIDELTATTAKKERMEGELHIAHDIQMRMIPTVFPPFPEKKNLDLYASMNPAKEVGGDLYDYFIMGDKLYFCIGDVSGKGIPASLFMAGVVAIFRTVGKQGLAPEEIATNLNDSMAENNDAMMFVTLFIGEMDLRSGEFRFCNCGHNPPLYFREGKTPPTALEVEANLPVGITAGFKFKGQSIKNFKENVLLLYTDGLNEAENKDHEQFGEERLVSELSKHSFKSAEATVSHLRKAVSSFSGDCEQSDDLTMLCLKVK